MPRNNLLLAIIVLVAMLGVWYVSTDRPSPESVTPTAPEPTLPLEPAPTATPTPRQKAVRYAELQQEVETLKAKLSEETQKLATQKSQLDRLYQSQRWLEGSGALSSQIRRRDLDIQDLMDELGQQRQAEDDVNRAAAVTLQNQESQANLAREQIDAAIRSVELEKQKTGNELTYWRDYVSGVEVKKQQATVAQLQEQLQEQEDQLRALRARRVEISEDVLQNSAVYRSLAEQARDDLRTSAFDVQMQVYSLRDEMDRLQETQSQVQNQLRVLNAQIATAEKEFNQHSRQIQDLKMRIQTKENEIRSE